MQGPKDCGVFDSGKKGHRPLFQIKSLTTFASDDRHTRGTVRLVVLAEAPSGVSSSDLRGSRQGTSPDHRLQPPLITASSCRRALDGLLLESLSLNSLDARIKPCRIFLLLALLSLWLAAPSHAARPPDRSSRSLSLRLCSHVPQSLKSRADTGPF